MPLIHRLLYALRALADDDLPPSRKKDKTPERSSSRHRQAVALVITFRDLFASGGLNVLLEDMEANRSNRKTKYNNSQCMDGSKCTLKDDAIASLHNAKMCETLRVALETESPLATSESVNFLADPRDNTVALFNGERIISSSELSIYHSAETPIYGSAESPTCGSAESPIYGSAESQIYGSAESPTCGSAESPIYTSAESPSRLLVPVNPQSGALEVYGRKKHKNLTVALSTENENKTVDALRKVLKWSPRKQSLAKFSVPLPKEEEYKAVAVVQNAVNRVKEEQEKKRRRKFKLFKLTFC